MAWMHQFSTTGASTAGIATSTNQDNGCVFSQALDVSQPDQVAAYQQAALAASVAYSANEAAQQVAERTLAAAFSAS